MTTLAPRWGPTCWSAGPSPVNPFVPTPPRASSCAVPERSPVRCSRGWSTSSTPSETPTPDMASAPDGNSTPGVAPAPDGVRSTCRSDRRRCASPPTGRCSGCASSATRCPTARRPQCSWRPTAHVSDPSCSSPARRHRPDGGPWSSTSRATAVASVAAGATGQSSRPGSPSARPCRCSSRRTGWSSRVTLRTRTTRPGVTAGRNRSGRHPRAAPRRAPARRWPRGPHRRPRTRPGRCAPGGSARRGFRHAASRRAP
jgi:hypothetical protein